jgi:hypothetical protein
LTNQLTLVSLKVLGDPGRGQDKQVPCLVLFLLMDLDSLWRGGVAVQDTGSHCGILRRPA